MSYDIHVEKLRSYARQGLLDKFNDVLGRMDESLPGDIDDLKQEAEGNAIENYKIGIENSLAAGPFRGTNTLARDALFAGLDYFAKLRKIGIPEEELIEYRSRFEEYVKGLNSALREGAKPIELPWNKP